LYYRKNTQTSISNKNNQCKMGKRSLSKINKWEKKYSTSYANIIIEFHVNMRYYCTLIRMVETQNSDSTKC
jgi:hypothetical protein